MYDILTIYRAQSWAKLSLGFRISGAKVMNLMVCNTFSDKKDI